MKDVPYVPLARAAKLLNMSPKTAKNQLVTGRFPVPTYKLGREHVVDLEVLGRFFLIMRSQGLAELDRKLKKRR